MELEISYCNREFRNLSHLAMNKISFEVNYSAKLQIAKIHEITRKIKCYLSFWLNRAYMKIQTPSLPCTDNTLFLRYFVNFWDL